MEITYERCHSHGLMGQLFLSLADGINAYVVLLEAHRLKELGSCRGSAQVSREKHGRPGKVRLPEERVLMQVHRKATGTKCRGPERGHGCYTCYYHTSEITKPTKDQIMPSCVLILEGAAQFGVCPIGYQSCLFSSLLDILLSFSF